MAKYGTFVYSSAKYGTGSAAPQPVITADWVYILNIKWSGWTNEAGRCVMAAGYRGRQFYVGKGGETFERIQPGEFTFTVDNSGLRFDPYNSSGPLYGSVEPGKAAEFSAKYVPTGTTYRIFTGHIKDIRPVSYRNQAQIIVTDDLQWLADQDITIPTAYNVKVSDCIGLTLDAAKYPYARSIAASNCPVTFFDPQQANALDTIRSLSDAGLGTVFVDRFGKLQYYDLSKTGQPTTTIDQAIIRKEITVTQPWDNVRNKITCVANRYGYGVLEEIWRLDEPIGVPASSVVSINITFDQARVMPPVRDDDYDTSSTYEDFVSGVGYLHEYFWFTVYLTNITSTGCTVNISNNETDYLYLSWLRLRGNKIENKKLTFESTDAASMAKGPRRLKIDSEYLQDRGFAAAYPGLLLAHLKNPSKAPVITLDTRPDSLGVDLLDKIHLTSAKLNIDATYDVGYISYKWLTPNGQSFEQSIYLQNILYSTVHIDPQQYYPTVPPIPEHNPNTGGPVTPGTGTQACLLTGTATGPYPVGGTTIDNATPSKSVNCGLWFRRSSNPYRTYIEVDAKWESFTGNVWAPDNAFDFSEVAIIGPTGSADGYGHLMGSKVVDGVRRYNFSNGDDKYCRSLRFKLDPATAGYAVGATIEMGVVDASNSAGTVISGLSVGAMYAIEGYGGPSYADSGSSRYIYFLNIGYTGSDVWGLVGGLSFYAGYVNCEDPVGPLVYAEEHVGDGNHGRLYLIAQETNITLSFPAESPASWGDNHGSTGYILYHATGGGGKRVTIKSIKYYNVCEGTA